MRYTKPFLSIDEQIERLRERGMRIDNEDDAQKALRHIGYYRLSAYWHPFRDAEGATVLDDFIENSNFQDVIDLYTFDAKLRALTFSAIAEIETSLRTSVARILGQHGPWAHRVPERMHGNMSRLAWNGRTHHWNWLSHIDKQEKRSKDVFATHHRTKYYATPDLPIWISVEVWDLSTLSIGVANLKYGDAQIIATQHGASEPREFATWTRTITFVRNVCAHHGRLWNRSLVDSPSLPQDATFAPYIGTSARQRVYPTLLLIGRMLDSIGTEISWHERLETIMQSFPDGPRISTEMMGKLAS